VKFESLATAYIDGLSKVGFGAAVPSVTDPYSKASDFGTADRPSREMIAHQFIVTDPNACLMNVESVPIHLPYSFALLAWTLDGRSDAETLAYYRPAATAYSDDGFTLSGAFGSRLLTGSTATNQLARITNRLREDPASRRTWAAIINGDDNLGNSREYPCAAGVQLFLRDGALHFLTVMRAQQALTVLPYDAFLFMAIQLVLANELGVRPGHYHHFAGTFHIYESELEVAAAVVRQGASPLRLPGIELAASEFSSRLVELESRVRAAARERDQRQLGRFASGNFDSPLLDLARWCFVSFAYARLKLDLPSDARPYSDPQFAAVIESGSRRILETPSK
jgi:thymidylate synthase